MEPVGRGPDIGVEKWAFWAWEAVCVLQEPQGLWFDQDGEVCVAVLKGDLV